MIYYNLYDICHVTQMPALANESKAVECKLYVILFINPFTNASNSEISTKKKNLVKSGDSVFPDCPSKFVLFPTFRNKLIWSTTNLSWALDIYFRWLWWCSIFFSSVWGMLDIFFLIRAPTPSKIKWSVPYAVAYWSWCQNCANNREYTIMYNGTCPSIFWSLPPLRSDLAVGSPPWCTARTILLAHQTKCMCSTDFGLQYTSPCSFHPLSTACSYTNRRGIARL